MALATLSIDLEARLAGLQDGMDKAARIAQQNANKIEASFAGIRESATAIGQVLVGALAGVSFVALVRNSIDAADHLNDLSKSTGIAVDRLGGIGFAASQAGTDLDGAAASMGKLNLAIAKAAAGDEKAAAVFDAIGVAVKTATGETRKADAVFADVATAFAKYKDGPEEAAIANELFGKSYQSILPLLADGGKALQQNIEFYQRFAGVTAETAAAADEFNDTLGKIKVIGGAVARQLAADMLPTLQAVADAFLEARENSDSFKTGAGLVNEAFKAIVIVAANTAFVVAAVGREIGAVAAQMVALSHLDLNGFSAISDAVKEDGEKARRELDKFEARIMSAADGFAKTAASFGGGGAKTDAPRLGGADVAAKAKTSELQKYVDTLIAAQVATLNFSTEEQAAYDIANNKLGKLTAAQEKQVLDLARGVDIMKAKYVELGDAQEAFRRSELAATTAVNDAMRRANFDDAVAQFTRLKELIGATPTAKLEAAQQDVRFLAEAFKEGTISAEQFNAAAAARLGLVGDSAKKATDDATAFAQQAARNIQDALGNTLEATITGHFDNIGKLWSDLLVRMASEALAAELGHALFGDFGKTGNIGGAAGQLLASLFGSANGNAFVGGSPVPFAKGGILGPQGGLLTRPTVFPMANGGVGIGGEAGIEAVMPLKRGADGKLGVASQGGGRSIVLHQQISIDARGADAGVEQRLRSALKQNKAETIAEVQALANRGGSFARSMGRR